MVGHANAVFVEKVELHLVAITQSETHPGNFALILEDTDRVRRLSITIGRVEAQAIAVVLENMTPVRPQTHDLLHQLIVEMGGRLVDAFIDEVNHQRFHAKLHIQQGKRMLSMDSRTSDAIALAVRAEAPIYTYAPLLEEMGFLVKDADQQLSQVAAFVNHSLEKLETLLEEALHEEDYQRASRIRDAITWKKKRET